jgi:nucleoside phosphorylase
MEEIFDILILSPNEKSWENFVYEFSKNRSVYRKFNALIFQDVEQFKIKFHEIYATKKFRLWIHLGMKTNKAGYEGESQADDLLNDPDLKHLNFQYITRSRDLNLTEIAGKQVYSIIKLRELDFNTIQTNNDKQAIPSGRRIDYAFITALYKVEFENLVSVFNLKKDESNLPEDWSYYLGVVNGKRIIAVYQNNSGAEDASSLTTKLISKFSPRYIFMTGVCGAPELAFGSIVISKFVFNINKGKIKDNTFFKELEVCKTHDIIINKLSSALSNSVSKLQSILISNPIYKKMYKGFDFQSIDAVIEPTACSSSVISDENYFKNVISNIDRKTAAVEMEGYGVMRAAELTNNGNTKAIIIKGVMDHADGNKNDDAKEFAALTSALFLKDLLENDVLG